MHDQRANTICVLLCAAQLWSVSTLGVPFGFKSESFLPFARNLAAAPTQGPQVNTLPVLYVYDHCPFCTRVRLALGLKGVKHELRFLANDDIQTPTALVGKKIAPICTIPGRIEPMPESMDIIRLIDSQDEFGKPGMFKPLSSRADLEQWQVSVSELNRKLQRPRFVVSNFPEFAHFASRNAFIRNHPLAPYAAPEWLNMSDAERWAVYDSTYNDSSAVISRCAESLRELEGLLYCEEYCTEGGLSYDDIDLWSRLRGVTLVKGLEIPPKVSAYLENLSVRGDVPLLYSMAC
jgi:GrxB family glutaredoxin